MKHVVGGGWSRCIVFFFSLSEGIISYLIYGESSCELRSLHQTEKGISGFKIISDANSHNRSFI